jgi:hypothetical protein
MSHSGFALVAGSLCSGFGSVFQTKVKSEKGEVAVKRIKVATEKQYSDCISEMYEEDAFSFRACFSFLVSSFYCFYYFYLNNFSIFFGTLSQLKIFLEQMCAHECGEITSKFPVASRQQGIQSARKGDMDGNGVYGCMLWFMLLLLLF